jgi:hypothetical protein
MRAGAEGSRRFASDDQGWFGDGRILPQAPDGRARTGATQTRFEDGPGRLRIPREEEGRDRASGAARIAPFR